MMTRVLKGVTVIEKSWKYAGAFAECRHSTVQVDLDTHVCVSITLLYMLLVFKPITTFASLPTCCEI
jgi:hypothetical protein